MNTLDILKAMRSIYVIEEGMSEGQEVEITSDLKVICGEVGWNYQWNGEVSERVDYIRYDINYKGKRLVSAEGSGAFDVLEASIRALNEVLAEAQANQRG